MDGRKLSFVSVAALGGWLVGRSMGLAAGGTAINAGPVAAVIFAGIAAILLLKLPSGEPASHREGDADNASSSDVANKLMQDSLSAANDLVSWVAIILRILWNLEMSLLAAIGLMLILRRQIWTFLALGLALLYFALPIGLVFIGTAFAAYARKPQPENDYIVAVR